MGVAVGIGGLPKEGAVYLFYIPSSSEPQTLALKDVPNGDNVFLVTNGVRQGWISGW